jgi:hypothetical protein
MQGLESLFFCRVTTLKLFSEIMINIIFSLVFDTAVIAVTLYKMWGVLKLQKELKIRNKESFTGLMLRQGERHLY